MDTGVVAGFPLQDIAVTVYDGKFHSVDSKEIAFVVAGRKAFYDAVSKAAPAVLEPVVNLDVVAPADTMGAVSADLSGKRGHLVGTSALPANMLDIKAQAPLAEMNQYAGELKAMTGGQGSYTLELSHYQPVPVPVQQQLAAEYQREDTDD
jgi:elongation factor G